MVVVELIDDEYYRWMHPLTDAEITQGNGYCGLDSDRAIVEINDKEPIGNVVRWMHNRGKSPQIMHRFIIRGRHFQPP